MGCGGCGKKRAQEKNKITVYRNQPRVPNTGNAKVWKPASRDVHGPRAVCPVCKTQMRLINKYDKDKRIVVKKHECPNPTCANK